MSLKITKISESEFTNLRLPILFNDTDYAQAYGIIMVLGKQYKLSWSSDLITPEINELRLCVFSVAVDNVFMIFDFRADRYLANLTLDHLFCLTAKYRNDLFVCTQFEVIKIDLASFDVVDKYAIPNIFESIQFFDDRIEVVCMDTPIAVTLLCACPGDVREAENGDSDAKTGVPVRDLLTDPKTSAPEPDSGRNPTVNQTETKSKATEKSP